MNTDTPASAEVTSALKQLESSNSPDKASGYNELLRNILSASTPDALAANLIAYVESILGESLGIVTSRPLLTSFVEQFRTVQSPDIKIAVAQHALSLLAPKVVSYEDADTQLKLLLADAHEELEDYTASAKTLQRINLDSPQRALSDDDKARIWIRIVRCYLEDDDPTSANAYLLKAKNVIHGVTSRETRLQFQLSQARILDAQRSFLDASTTYLAISNEGILAEDERLQALSAAMVCAVLAPAGPLRAKTLGRLYKDERAAQCDEFGILEKIYLNRLLSPAEVRAFAEEKLRPHQLARTADGSTVLDKAVLEHNLLGASRLYSNIGIEELGVLLGVDAEKAEGYAAQMIEQGRLAGWIDQIERLIFFEGEGSGERKTGHVERVVGREIRKWDANVQGLAEEVERVTTMIQNQYPEFYAAHMVH